MATIRVLAISAVLVTVMSAGDTPCPNSCSCPSRYRADCCNSSLTRIPKNFVSDLRFLNASGNNFRALRQGNFSATNVRQLKILDLSNNKISTVETGCLSELEELIFLYLSRNEIAVFSQDVFGTNRRLEFLKLDKNILDLPIGRPFLDIPSLRSLDMASCSIESLPEKTFIRVPNLEELRLSHNRLKTLDRKTFLPLRSLKSLLLSDNLLRTLQEDLFVTLKELTYLDLSDNQLQELHPQVFTFMESVEHLDLSGNRLKALEIGVFTPLTSLKRLHLHRNVLNSLNERQFSELNNLALLDLSGNHLEHVQFRIICHLNNLTYLKLSDNRLSCNCALWELWNWSLENGVRILSTCEESDFEFSVKNFEFLRVNNSCNATLCDIELETEYSEGLISVMYIYVIICVGLLLVLIACFFTTFVVFRYRKEFCKRRNIQVSALEFSQNTITYVERQHEEYILHAQRQRELQEELRRQHNKTLMRNRLQIDQSTSLKILPRTEHRNLRHSYHEYRLPSVADDEREWCNADTLPSNNRTSVFLASMSSHPIEQEPTPKNISRSEPKLKDYSKNLSVFNGTDSKSDIIPLSVSSLKCQPPREAPKFENIHDVSSSESETVEL